MEQRKLLVIIISVSVFLAVILGVGLFWFYPKPKPVQDSPAASGPKTNFDPIEWVRTREDYPPIGPADPKATEKKEDVIIVYGEKKKEERIVRNVEPKQAPTPPPAQPRTQPTPLAKKEVPASAPAQKAASAKPASKAVKTREFVIQVGSFSSRDKAEQAAKTLKEKGLAGAINSRTVNESQFYRLRLGPYANRNEAEKFLEWVKSVQGFQDSMIFETGPARP
jgi:cell division septation protein DedD